MENYLRELKRLFKPTGVENVGNITILELRNSPEEIIKVAELEESYFSICYKSKEVKVIKNHFKPNLIQGQLKKACALLGWVV